MGRINVARVILGGLVAGIVANAFDFVINNYLMMDEGSEMIARLNLNPATVESSVTTWIIVDMIWGILLVFTYAGIRPRFGPGPKTAIIAGIIPWFAVLLTMTGLMSMGVFTQQAWMKSSLLYLVSSLAATLAGAAVYKE
jgi:hypothetical protein